MKGLRLTTNKMDSVSQLYNQFSNLYDMSVRETTDLLFLLEASPCLQHESTKVKL